MQACKEPNSVATEQTDRPTDEHIISQTNNYDEQFLFNWIHSCIMTSVLWYFLCFFFYNIYLLCHHGINWVWHCVHIFHDQSEVGYGIVFTFFLIRVRLWCRQTDCGDRYINLHMGIALCSHFSCSDSEKGDYAYEHTIVSTGIKTSTWVPSLLYLSPLTLTSLPCRWLQIFFRCCLFLVAVLSSGKYC